MPSATFTADAVVAARSFSIRAYIINDRAQQHHRQNDHYGADSDLIVVLSKNIGKYVAYTPIHYVLEDLLARVALLEDYSKVRASFVVDATITGNSIYLNAILKATRTFTGTTGIKLDAHIIRGGSFTLNATIMPRFTINAFIV